MSPRAWSARLAERPIAEHERRHTLIATVLLLLALTATFTLAKQPVEHSHAQTARARALRTTVAAHATTPPTAEAPVLSRQEGALASRFLDGYLAHIYGRASARRIGGVTPKLRASLLAASPRVSSAMRARRPRVLALTALTATEVRAVIADGGVSHYALTLSLVHDSERLLVAQVKGG